MSTSNESARRGLGNSNEAARRGLGQGNEAARRNLGSAMVERRTGQSLVEEINSVIAPRRTRQPLKTIAPRGPLPAQTSPGLDTPNPEPRGGGGIASPLAAIERTFSATPVFVETFDGSGLFRVKALDTLKMLDAEGREVVITDLAFEPPAP
jgi:hypothetical protein